MAINTTADMSSRVALMLVFWHSHAFFVEFFRLQGLHLCSICMHTCIKLKLCHKIMECADTLKLNAANFEIVDYMCIPVILGDVTPYTTVYGCR